LFYKISFHQKRGLMQALGNFGFGLDELDGWNSSNQKWCLI
jgi:hypothetical protein